MIKTPAQARKILKGVSLNRGKAAAPVCLFSHQLHKNVPEYILETIEEIERDALRFETALEKSLADLEGVVKTVSETLGRVGAEIFAAQKHMMLDPLILSSIRGHIRDEKRNAEHAVSFVLGQYEEKFGLSDNVYLKERVNDIAEIRRRLLDHLRDTKPGFLCEGQEHCSRGADRIIVAHELTPSMIAYIDVTRVRGFVTAHGGVSSHAAILARAIGVPAVSGIRNVMDLVECGHVILLDGDKGEVHFRPDKADLVRQSPSDAETPGDAYGIKTPEGMEVLANINLIEELEMVDKMCADGIGLFRTEFMFIRADRLLNEDEQASYYTDVVRRMKGKPVTFRLLDVGGDKPLSFLKQEAEGNPYLGLRGARFLLKNRELFNTQVRALARASAAGPVKVLFPMVVDVYQMKLLMEAADNALAGVKHKKKNLSFGAMFEVVSALLQAKEIFSLAQFGSIGSNDLIQYLFAVDRNNEDLRDDYDPHHPVLWGLLADLQKAAKESGRPLSICGEMASLPGMAGRLLKTGITSLSVSPRLIPQVRKEMIRFKAG